MIGRCLASVRWADEIIVLDSGSTDRTVAICREAGANVIVTDWPGFGPQKNRALEQATGTWVLSLDADEYLTEEAQAEIRAALASEPAVDAFRMPRLSSYCGRFMRHGDCCPDYVTRLFRRGCHVIWGRPRPEGSGAAEGGLGVGFQGTGRPIVILGARRLDPAS